MSGLKIMDLDLISLQQLTQLSLDCRVFIHKLKDNKKKKKRKRNRFTLQRRQKTTTPTTALQYWAESIENVRLNSEHELLFEVKWENYSPNANTWQSVRDLFQCHLLFQDFHRRQFSPNDVIAQVYSSRDLERLSRVVSESASDCCDLAILQRLSDDVILDKLELKRVKQKLEIWSLALRRARRVKHEDKDWYLKILVRQCVLELHIERKFETLEEFLAFCDERRETELKLREWSDDVNTQIVGEPMIEVQNNWDLEVPQKLQYLQKHLIQEDLLLEPRLLQIQCQCPEDCSRNRTCICALKLYKDGKRFKTSHVVYECNSNCQCGLLCPNRRIQRGRQSQLTVFRTRDRGWGVLTRQRINFGEFVFEYNGEVIDSRQTRSRDSTYFFNIDSEFCGQTLFVDGNHYGNITRFANHSCEPNLDVHLAFVNGLDCVPRIAFFANRRIEVNEELTYDYKRNVMTRDLNTGEYVKTTVKDSDDDSGYSVDTNSTKSEDIQCFCNSKNCKKFI